MIGIDVSRKTLVCAYYYPKKRYLPWRKSTQIRSPALFRSVCVALQGETFINDSDGESAASLSVGVSPKENRLLIAFQEGIFVADVEKREYLNSPY